jgi:hypothetical protein
MTFKGSWAANSRESPPITHFEQFAHIDVDSPKDDFPRD